VILYLTTDEPLFSPLIRALIGFGVIMGLLPQFGVFSVVGLLSFSWSSDAGKKGNGKLINKAYLDKIKLRFLSRK